MNARERWVAISCLAATLAAGCTAPPEQEPIGAAAAAAGDAGADAIELFVVLAGPSAVAAVGPSAASGDPAAVARTRARLAELARQHDAVRPLLLGAGATVITELRRLANVIQVRAPRSAIDKLRGIPEVVALEPVPLFERTLASALPTVGAPRAWASGAPVHGDGVTIGILDTGVDYLHADFGGVGDPAAYDNDDHTIVEDGSFPTLRVIGGYDFAGDDYDPSGGVSTPVPDDDPIDCDGHGTHVAGIAAGSGVLADGSTFEGPYEQSLELGQFRVAPGVAPRASLYAIKIFGCDGATRLVAAGLEWAADPNDDGDFSDRIDVVNASLGSAYGAPTPTHEQVLDAYDTLGGVFVAAAGNEGGTFFVAGSPGTFPRALSVAATVDASFITLAVESPVGIAGDYAAVEGTFTAPLVDVGPLTGALVAAEPLFACEPLQNASALAGKIALIDRGDCLFHEKLTHAAQAGAIGAVVVNNNFDAPSAMSPSDTGGTVDIPAVMIRLLDGNLLREALPSGVTVTLSRAPFVGVGAETIAGFSARGPAAIDGRLKPELAAPGVAIESANVGSGTEPTSKQGTSMAAPLVAGAAALVRQLQPTLSPTALKATLMNSAAPMVDASGRPYPITLQGSGRLDVARALEQQVTATVEGDDGSIAVTFAPLTTATPSSTERSVLVQNHGAQPVTLSASAAQVHALPGVTVSVSPPELTVAPGATATLLATLTVDPLLLGNPSPDPVTPTTQLTLPRHALTEADGHILLSDAAGETTLSLPFFGVVKAASALVAAPPRGCALASGEVVSVTLAGSSAHPSPTITAFELGIASPSMQATPPELDIRAVGVATDAPTALRFEEASVHFGVAVEGEWTTPARGGQSLVVIAIDNQRDGAFDYILRAEAMNAEDPFYDVIATTVYELSTGTQVGSKRYANLVPANEADTQPFYNSVLVLSAFAHDIGLDEENTAFDYLAVGEGFLGAAKQTSVATFDVMSPRVDPARAAPRRGLPLFGADEPIIAHLGARDESGRLPELLLLHHNGERGARIQTVDLSFYETDAITVAHTFPATIAPSSRPAGKVVVRNEGDVPLHDVTLTGTVNGATFSVLAPSHGRCGDGPAIACELGPIPPNRERSLTVQLVATDDVATAGLALSVRTAAGCELPIDVTMSVSEEVAKPPTLDVGGGCGCHVLARATDPCRSPPWWAGLGLLLFFARRRLRMDTSRVTARASGDRVG